MLWYGMECYVILFFAKLCNARLCHIRYLKPQNYARYVMCLSSHGHLSYHMPSIGHLQCIVLTACRVLGCTWLFLVVLGCTWLFVVVHRAPSARPVSNTVHCKPGQSLTPSARPVSNTVHCKPGKSLTLCTVSLASL